MNQFLGTRVAIVPEGALIQHGGHTWEVAFDTIVKAGDTLYTTEEGYDELLLRLPVEGYVGSRYLQ